MARSIALIKQQMIDAKNAEAALAGLTSTSQTAIWNLWFYIVAASINVFEQLQDVFKSELETIQNNARPGTEQWVQSMTNKWQYDGTYPQIIGLVDLVPTYPTVDATKRIVTRCSVTTDTNKIVNIKVAKSEPPAPLSSPERTSLVGYWNVVGVAGVSYNIISADSDKIEIVGDIYYDGQYALTIAQAVKDAINNYLSTLDFNGNVYVTKIEDAIQNVQGVKDVKLSAINCRRDTQPYGTGSVVYNLTTGTNARTYSSYAGYITEETTTSHTFTDTLTFIVA